MTFEQRLYRTLCESNSEPRIVGVKFIPAQKSQYAAEVTYDDGLIEILFTFDPKIVSFSRQELIGLTRMTGKWLKDKKLDDAIGIEYPA